eukprot:CAMPEP_0172635108 /NCGR_PEP_ID=MMETSP1068-20121228/197659_1 /TAXON_ID=35684 /ORGANISM="Pseudopedinella elastica, Strain CCMP716" /LENGTH=109 /DNA_ID=CAMNT_0013447219 /DNA_START=123 /DNA_END=452 /DNA_ORIENTATION=+
MCALAIFESLGYKARWIVDWADHLWVEVLVAGKWVHCDPCEASVNEPLLYQGWGKNQTYIIAFGRDHIEDVTGAYTSDLAAARNRRDDSDSAIQLAIKEVQVELFGTSI